MLQAGAQNTSLEICPLPKTRAASRRSLALRMSKRRGRTHKAGPRQPNGQLRRHRHAPEDPGRPTPQRFRHGDVARLDKPIADDDGRPVRPYRAASFLSALEAAGLIDKKMLAAGDDFRAQFYKAKFDRLGAAQLVRSSRSTGTSLPPSRVEDARDAIWRSICAVGGLASQEGSCLWHVIGFECDLARWALEQGWIGRRITVSRAQDILISTLASLKEHDL
jgi:hypothetical protein